MTEASDAREGFVRRHWHWLAIVLLVVVFFADPLFTGRVFFYRDLGILMHPVLQAASDVAGEAWPLSLWSHLFSSGRAITANPGYAAFTPLSIPYGFDRPDFHLAFDAFLVGHVLIGACGATFLARRLGASRAGAFTAGAAYGLGGGMISSIAIYWTSVSAAYAPWTLAAALDACRRPALPRVALLAAALGLQGLGGQPEPILATIVVGVALSIATAEGGALRRAGVVLGSWAAAGAWALALAAPELLPGALLTRTTLRSLGFSAEGVLYNSLDPRALPSLAVPRWGGHPMELFSGGFPGSAWTDSGTPYLITCYLGASVVVLAVLGALRLSGSRGTRGIALALSACAVLGVVLALGRHVPGARALVEAAPFRMPLRYPVKALYVTFLAVPALAAFGVQAVESSRLRRFVPVVVAIVALDLALAHQGYAPTAPRSSFAAPPLVAELQERARALGVAPAQWRLHHQRFPDRSWNDVRIAPPTEEATFLWRRRMLMPPTGAPFGVHHVMEATGDLLDDLAYLELTREAYASPPPDWARALGRAGALFVISPKDDLERTTEGVLVLERAIGEDLGVPAGSGFLYRDTAFVERATLEGAGRVTNVKESILGLRVHVLADEPTTLRVSDALGDFGAWRATVDEAGRDEESAAERPVAIERWNGAFAQVAVPAGGHHVTLRYVPRGLVAGGVLWALATIGLLVVGSRSRAFRTS